ncbi:hopanoid biosynthesis associated protein HpnK [Hyphomicrobium methylovorum]|uniref:hopanoid biosynthesis-associated protein HpnK n=1 Tax=Hyphomicrobium methylovorum TaxID=84 RepID=UPI0015E7239A|nr:hopanoid biosynthesis-associated protein HpnK [Hyphomicrobium methylovorum]MBA2125471.1 hopanoid biosynthesis associated protein HpnK [Hyphomicrobium methylovorum]
MKTSSHRLIVTADDFGLSVPVNEAVEQAHERGILTAASLMTGAPACDEAVERARRLPRLGVGLHLTLVDGRPVLPASEVPGLVGPDGRFSTDPTKFGTALFFSSELRRQAEAEITAQFEAFRRTGLPLDHVNGHQHFHMHPVISKIIARLAPAFGNPGVRIPVEPPLASYRAAGDRLGGRLSAWAFYVAQTRLLRRRVRSAGLPVNRYVFGLNESGAMIESRVLAFLDHIPAGPCEIYFHPATRRWDGVDNLPVSYRPVDEFSALTSAAVKAKVAALGITLVPFRGAFG